MASRLKSSTRPKSSETNSYINEIHQIYCEHQTKLDAERRKAIDNIDAWHRRSQGILEKYTNEQKAIFNKEYDRLQGLLVENYEENRDIAHSYYKAKQKEPFKELRETYRSLEYQIASLKHSKLELEYSATATIQEFDDKSQLESTEKDKQKDARHRRRTKTTSKTTDNTNNNGKSSSTNSNQPSNEQNVDNLSEKKDNPLDATNNTSNDDVRNYNNENDKCPICYMIYPSYMKHCDKQLHVNEHMADEHDSH